jgi:hypothetical protein
MSTVKYNKYLQIYVILFRRLSNLELFFIIKIKSRQAVKITKQLKN